MLPLLYDEWLYLKINGIEGSYGKEEFERGHKSRCKNVMVACLDVAVKHIRVDPSLESRKEELVAAAVPAGNLAVTEWPAPQEAQLMSVEQSKIEEIYAYFGADNVAGLVAYQTAIRAFLKSKGLLSNPKAVLVVDDLKNMAVVTVFSGLKFSNARQIAMRDMEYMTQEIKRTWQNFNDHVDDIPGPVLVCNNREWLNAFLALKITTNEDCLHIESAYPVLEGLKGARFNMSFMAPKDLARRRRRELFKKNMSSAAVFLATAALSAGAYGYCWMNNQEQQEALKLADLELKNVQHDLAGVYRVKLADLLESTRPTHSDDVYLDLLSRMPAGYRVKEFTMENSTKGETVLNALLLPEDAQEYGQVRLEGGWEKAELTDEKVNDAIATRVRLKLTNSSEHDRGT